MAKTKIEINPGPEQKIVVDNAGVFVALENLVDELTRHFNTGGGVPVVIYAEWERAKEALEKYKKEIADAQ